MIMAMASSPLLLTYFHFHKLSGIRSKSAWQMVHYKWRGALYWHVRKFGGDRESLPRKITAGDDAGLRPSTLRGFSQLRSR
jgi:hypothetical protein